MTVFQQAMHQVGKISKKKLKAQYPGMMESMSPTAYQLKTHRVEAQSHVSYKPVESAKPKGKDTVSLSGR